MMLPLHGIRVLAVEQYGAGPWASMYLSDMGAEVIKVEDPAAGDASRQSGPHFLGPHDSQFYQTFNLGKKSLALDLRAPEGRAVLERLIPSADILLNNLRGDQPAKLRLTHSDMAPLNPRLVCGHLSGYGRAGPRATWPAYDYLMQAEAGFMHVTGEPGTPPTRMGLSIVDYLSGITLAYACTAALVGALKSGRGRDVDVTLYDVAMHQLTYPATWYLNTGEGIERRPRSGHPSVVPCEVFPTADGHMFLMCVLPKFWQALCEALNLSRLSEDPAFATPRARFDNRDALATLLDAALIRYPTAHWMGLLAGKVPAAPVLTLAEALDNPYLAQTGGIQTPGHPAFPGLRTLSNPIRLDGVRSEARTAPALGADTRDLLIRAGYSEAELNTLASRSVIGGLS